MELNYLEGSSNHIWTFYQKGKAILHFANCPNEYKSMQMKSPQNCSVLLKRRERIAKNICSHFIYEVGSELFVIIDNTGVFVWEIGEVSNLRGEKVRYKLTNSKRDIKHILSFLYNLTILSIFHSGIIDLGEVVEDYKLMKILSSASTPNSIIIMTQTNRRLG